MILDIDGRTWRTPVTAFAGRQVGRARLKKHRMSPGLYPFEGTDGYEAYNLTSPLTAVVLQRCHQDGWHTWMTDDPLHWHGMRAKVAQLPAGRILCAGLGLGLMVHHLVKRDDITSITVVEVHGNVIDLIRPSLPDDRRVTILQHDFYEFLRFTDQKFDAILWDLAVGSGEAARAQLLTGLAMTMLWATETPIYQFGVRKAQNVLGGKR